jgi:ABC-type cobalamin/Fe3+-siderophores transport system ATPase subunit
MLELRSLYASYNGKDVLKDINLQVAPGEVLALIGPNGAGKTTLIRAASGVLRPKAGKVFARERISSSCPLTCAPAVWRSSRRRVCFRQALLFTKPCCSVAPLTWVG